MTRREPVTMDEYRALAQFRRALRSFLHFSEQAARDVGLTPAQHQLLLAIKGNDSGDEPTIRELAESLKVHHNSAVELIDRAAAAGLVEREHDPVDGRIQRLALTDLGERKLAALAQLHRDELRRFKQEMLEQLDVLG
jgi:DNA-binding MarR family transcriptional regulator